MKKSRVLLLSVFLLCAGFFSVSVFASGTVTPITSGDKWTVYNGPTGTFTSELSMIS
jgi:hypothetical protein